MCVNIIRSLRNQSQNIDYDHCKVLGLVSVSCKNDQCSIMKNISLAQAIGQLYFHSNSVCLFQGAHTLMYNHTSLKSWRHYRSSVALFLLDVAAWCSSAQCFTPGDYSYAIPADHKVYYSRVANTGGEMQGAFPKELLHLACILVLYEPFL